MIKQQHVTQFYEQSIKEISGTYQLVSIQAGHYIKLDKTRTLSA